MPTGQSVAKYMREIKSRTPDLPIPDPYPEEISPGLISRAISGLFDVGLSALDALDYVAAIPRAGLGKLFGVEGSGRETFLGAAPSGRQLLGLGEGAKGEFEWADLPGFAAELALDPSMYFGIGELTKAGQAANRARGLAAKINVARGQLKRLPGAAKIAGTAERKAAAGSIKEMRTALKDLGYDRLKDIPEYGRLGAQARSGERSLLSLGIPFTDIKTPLSISGGRIGELALGNLGKAAHGVTRIPGIRQATRALRPGGRIGIEDFEHLTPDVLRKIATVNEEINAAQALARGARNLGPRLIEQTFSKLDNISEIKYADLERVGGEDMLRERAAVLIKSHDEAVAINNMHYGMEFDDIGAKIAEVDDKIAVVKNSQLGNEGFPLKINEKSVRKLQKQRDKLLSQQEQLGYKHKLQQERILATTARKLAPAHSALFNTTEITERLGPELTQRINGLHAAMGEALESSKSLGVNVSAMTDPSLMYMHRAVNPAQHTLTEAVLGRDNEFIKFAAKDQSAKQSFVHERIKAWEGVDVPTINQIWSEQMDAALADMAQAAEKAGEPNGISLAKQYRRDFEKIKNEGFFSEHPTESILKRFTQGAKANAAAARWNGAVNLHALPRELAGHGAVPVEKVIQKGAKEFGVFSSKSGMKLKDIAESLKGSALEGQYVPKDIVEAMTRVSTAMKDPDELNWIIGLGEKVNSIYRFWATQLFPSFHARNAASNVFMGALAGMKNPLWYARAAKQQWLAKQGDKAAIRLIDEAITHGSLGRSQVNEIAELLGKSRTSRIATMGKAGELLSKGGSTIEDNAKLAMYMWAKKSKGLTASEAGDIVKKYLFDYEDLSRFEKKYLRRIAFFYTYARKSMPLLVEQMLLKPKNLSMYGRLTGEIGSRRDERDILPPWVRERLPIGAGTDKEGNQRFLQTGLPPENLMQFSSEGRGIQRVAQKMAAMAAPVIRLPIEYATGVQLSTGLPQHAPTGIFQKLVEAAPQPLKKHISQLGRLESALPTARGTSTIKRIAEVVAGERTPSDAALSLGVGLTTKSINPQEQDLRNRLRKINMALDNAITIGEGSSSRAKELRSLRARLSRRLEKIKK